jgi:hypothetical protein
LSNFDDLDVADAVVDVINVDLLSETVVVAMEVVDFCFEI